MYANRAALVTLKAEDRNRVRVTAPKPNVAPVTTTAMIATTRITSMRVKPLFVRDETRRIMSRLDVVFGVELEVGSG